MTALAAAWCALTVVVAPARIPIGTAHSQARVVVSGLPSKASQVRLWASLGEVSAASAAGNGQLEALYHAPAAGPPAFAVIAAWDEASGEVAVAAVELEARTEIPVETEPGAQVVVTVGNHRGSAHADAEGRATALVWAAPGVRTAKVTALDAAGNATTAEVALDIPTPERVWIVEREPLAGAARLFAFTLGPAIPEIRASGGVAVVSSQPGLASVTVRGTGDAMVTAIVGEAAARRAVHLGSPPPQPPEVVIVDVRPARFVDPRDDLGASVGPRFSGSLVDAAATLEWRHRLRRSRFHVGLDIGALYARGNGASDTVQLGGAFARVVGEARFFVAAKVALTAGLGVGGAVVGEHRTPLDGNDYTRSDGGPSVGGQVGVLSPLGPGVMTITLGFYYTPLLGLDRTILDGGALSVGYRSVRF